MHGRAWRHEKLTKNSEDRSPDLHLKVMVRMVLDTTTPHSKPDIVHPNQPMMCAAGTPWRMARERGGGGVRVLHSCGGATLVFKELGGDGLELPEAVSFEWLQQVYV